VLLFFHMKNAIILHGISSYPEQFWFPYIKEHLEKKGYSVWVPQLPEPDNPQINLQLPFVLSQGTFTEETVLIGHSSGASLILSVLEAIDVKIKQAILVSGFLLRGDSRPPHIVKDEQDYNWEKMREQVSDIIFINADNDPWGCNDEQGARMFTHLGGTQIIRHGQGHMGSVTYNQPYTEFPFLSKLI